MNKSSILILFFAVFSILSCGLCGNFIDDLKAKFEDEYVKHEYTSQGEDYPAQVHFGENEGVNFKEKEKFTETSVMIVPISAKITLPHEIDVDKIRTTIYMVKDGLTYLMDRFTNNISKDWNEFYISLPIYSPGFYKVDFEYENGQVFATGIVEVEKDED